jgi:DNA-binding winged helix-turn-helix (wHTH) protein
MNQPVKEYRFGSYRLINDERHRYLYLNDSPSLLSLREFKTLRKLVENQGKTVYKKDLYFSENDIDNDVEQTISKIRKRFFETLHTHKFIKTEPGGYSFVAEVKVIHEGDVELPESVGSSPGWKKMFLYICFALLIASLTTAGFLMFYDKKIDDFTRITIDKATIHLDLNNPDWRDLNDIDRQKGEKNSTAIYHIDYQVRKHFEVDLFSQRLGTFSNRKFEWDTIDTDKEIPLYTVEDVLEDSKKCSPGLTYANMLYFDISAKNIREPFNLKFKVFYYNGHNKQKKEDHSFFVHRPIDVLEFKISFPQSKPYPITRLFKLEGCNDVSGGVVQPKKTQAESPKEYVIENPAERTILWYIENPSVTRSYRIQWDWQYEEPSTR